MFTSVAEEASALLNTLRKSFDARFGSTDQAARAAKPDERNVQISVFTLLKSAPKSGSEIVTSLRNLSAGSWQPNQADIFPLLEEAREAGLIEFKLVKSVKVFSLTQDGESWLVANRLDEPVDEKVSEGPESDAVIQGSRALLAEKRMFLKAITSLTQAVGGVTTDANAKTYSQAAGILTDASKAIFRLLGDSK